MIQIKYIHASCYITRADLSKNLNMSLGAVDKRLKEIRDEIKNGRYTEYALIKDGGFMLVNYLVWIDYMAHRDRLLEKNLRKNVPAYNPAKIAREIGWYEEAI